LADFNFGHPALDKNAPGSQGNLGPTNIPTFQLRAQQPGRDLQLITSRKTINKMAAGGGITI